MKALRKASAERYTTAAELAQEVQRYLADEPVQAYAEPWTSRVLRWARRHKTAVSAAAALLLTATTALAYQHGIGFQGEDRGRSPGPAGPPCRADADQGRRYRLRRSA